MTMPFQKTYKGVEIKRRRRSGQVGVLEVIPGMRSGKVDSLSGGICKIVAIRCKGLERPMLVCGRALGIAAEHTNNAQIACMRTELLHGSCEVRAGQFEIGGLKGSPRSPPSGDGVPPFDLAALRCCMLYSSEPPDTKVVIGR
jgi:hypothetical protein